MGVEIGTYMMPPDSGNKLGYYENEEFMYLNELMLRAAGGSWDNPPPQSRINEIGPMFSYEIKNLVKRSVEDLCREYSHGVAGDIPCSQ